MHCCLPLVGYSEDVGTIVVASPCDDDDTFTGDDMIGGDSPSILCCIN